nr:MAG TPA: hypothetical protein [Caudoviricetes sp.]
MSITPDCIKMQRIFSMRRRGGQCAASRSAAGQNPKK